MNDEPRQTEPLKRTSRLPRTVILLGFTSLFTDVGSEMIFPLLPLFVVTLGAGPAYLGLIEGIADGAASLLKLATGYAAERLPRKPLVLFGYAIASSVRPLMAIATAPWHVLCVRVTDRIGKGIRTSPRDVMIAAAAPAGQTGRAFGFHRAMDHAGAVIGPLLATLLLALGFEVRQVFWFAAIPGILAVLCVLWVREQRHVLPLTKARVARGKLPPALWQYLAILFVFSLGNASDAFLLYRAQGLGVQAKWIPLLWVMLHVVKLTCSYLAGSLSDRVPRVRLIIAGWLVYALVYVGLGLAQRPWHVWLGFLVYGVYYGLTEPCEKALINDLSTPENSGRAFGFYNFTLGVSAILASLIAGGVWQKFGPFAALSIGAFFGALSALSLLAWSRFHSATLRAAQRMARPLAN